MSNSSSSPTAAPAAASSGSFASWLRSMVDDLFGLDTRALAITRIMLGFVLLRDIWVRSQDLIAFYSDRGALPRDAILAHLDGDWHFSFHMMNGEWQFNAVLFAIQAVFAVMFLVGWKTRLATVVSWLFVISLHARGSIQLQAGDIVLRLLLFWGMFLPWGARASVDAVQNPSPHPVAGRVVTVATAAYGLQMAIIYFFTAILKSGKAWFDGSAVYYALSIDFFGKQPFCSLIVDTPSVVEVIGSDAHAWLEANIWSPIDPNVPWAASAFTFLTIIFEWAGPVLLFFPFRRATVRALVVFGFIAMHLGFFAGLEIGLFPWICIAGWMALVPSPLLDRAGWREEPGLVRPVQRANWRHNTFAFFFLVLVVNWNLSTIRKQWPKAPIVPSEVRWLGHLLRLDQNWNMFAPYPLKDDGWYVIPGVLAGGGEVDLWAGGAPNWVPVDTSDGHKPILHPKNSGLELDRTKPELVSSMYPSQRWRKYMRNIWMKQYKDLRLYYGKHLCREWNATHRGEERLMTFRMVYMKELTPKPGDPAPRIDPVQIWDHNCFAKTTDEDKK